MKLVPRQYGFSTNTREKYYEFYAISTVAAFLRNALFQNGLQAFMKNGKLDSSHIVAM